MKTNKDLSAKIEPQLQELGAQLDNIKATTTNTWKDLRASVIKAWHSLQRSFENLVRSQPKK